MAQTIGNLAIIISGNARPFQQALGGVKRDVNQFSNNRITIRPPGDPSTRLQFGSWGRLARSALMAGFGGGLAGAVAGVAAFAFGDMLRHTLSIVGEVGHKAGAFLSESFQQGVELTRMQLSLGTLAGSESRGAEWIDKIRSLSTMSGFGMPQLHGSAQTLAGSFEDVNNVIPALQRVAVISMAIGANSEQMNRFSLAVAQVSAKGRFMAQELNQLSEAGLPLSEIAKTMGLSVGEFRNQVEHGNVSSDVLFKTLQRLTEAGGRFAGAFSAIGRSPIGQLNRIETGWQQFKSQLGQDMLQIGKDSGIFDAIERGLNYLLSHESTVKAFLNQGAELLKGIAIIAVRIAGTFYDWWRYLGGLPQLIRLIATGMGAFAGGLTGLMAGGPAGMIAGVIAGGLLGDMVAREMVDGIKEGMGKGQTWWSTRTGDQWAADLADSFDRRFIPKAKASMDKLRIPFAPPPGVADLMKRVSDKMGKGITPFDEFKKEWYTIGQAKRYSPRKLKEDTARAMDEAYKFRDSLSDSLGILDTRFEELRKSQHDALMKRTPQGDAEYWKIQQQMDENRRQRQSVEKTGKSRLENLWEIYDSLAKAKPGFGKEQSDFAIYEAFTSLEKAMGTLTDKFPEAMQQGSQEAASAISKAVYGSASSSVQERIANVLQLMKANSDKTKSDVKEIADAVRKAAATGVLR